MKNKSMWKWIFGALVLGAMIVSAVQIIDTQNGEPRMSNGPIDAT